MFRPHKAICVCHNKPRWIVVRAGLCKQGNQEKKAQDKVARRLREHGPRRLTDKLNRESLPALKKELWKWFSLYIRLRDSRDGWFTCLSCGRHLSARGGNLQAGHYHKSELSAALRYDERNVNGQCSRCNVFLEGNRQGYERGLAKKYGKDVLTILDVRKNNKVKWGRFEYRIMIEEYKVKVEGLVHQKKLP